MIRTLGCVMYAPFRAGLRAETLHSSKRDRGRVVDQTSVTNAFIGKPEEPCSLTGWFDPHH